MLKTKNEFEPAEHFGEENSGQPVGALRQEKTGNILEYQENQLSSMMWERKQAVLH